MCWAPKNICKCVHIYNVLHFKAMSRKEPNYSLTVECIYMFWYIHIIKYCNYATMDKSHIIMLCKTGQGTIYAFHSNCIKCKNNLSYVFMNYAQVVKFSIKAWKYLSFGKGREVTKCEFWNQKVGSVLFLDLGVGQMNVFFVIN